MAFRATSSSSRCGPWATTSAAARGRSGGRRAGAGGGRLGALRRTRAGRGPGAVVVTGGHREEATDVFFDGDVLELIRGERQADGAGARSGWPESAAPAGGPALG